MHNGQKLTWRSAAVIWACQFLLFAMIALIDMYILRRKFGFHNWVSQIALLAPFTIFILILSSKYQASLSRRLKIPKAREFFVILGLAVIAALALKPSGFPREYFMRFMSGKQSILLPGLEMPKQEVFQFLIFGCLLFPALEEILYREILLKRLIMNYSSFSAIIITSLIFGLSHFSPGSLSIILMSIISSIIYLYSDSLTLAVIFHTLYNTSVLASSALHKHLGPFFFSVWYLLIVVAGVFGIFFLLTQLKKDQKKSA